jgi:acyl-[acyl-carrier-protein]-phospholipid O-acyltransferase/long-chain-fatty-acid--[acyl-carrier-protein] ligase
MPATGTIPEQAASRPSAFQRISAFLPDWLLRFLLWTLRHTIYHIKVLGRENVPLKGGALFVPNHMSWVDILLLLAASPRPVRFLMLQEI